MSRLARTVFPGRRNGSVFYSRNGQFKLDENRNPSICRGMQLTGYPATGTPPTIQQGESCADHHSEHADGGEIDHHRASMQVNLNQRTLRAV